MSQMNGPAYIDPLASEHMKTAPQRIREAIRRLKEDAHESPVDGLREVTGFSEFIAGCDPTPTRAHDVIVAFYAFALSDHFACLKTPFLISMISAVRADNAARDELSGLMSELMDLTIPAISCLIDVYTSASSGTVSISGYTVPEVLPLEQIAVEFVAAFGSVIIANGDETEIFAEKIADNTLYYDCHLSEARSLERIKSGTETFLDWSAAMSQSLSGFSHEESMQAYSGVIAKCANDASYNALLQECTRRKVALLKSSQRLREFETIVKRITTATVPASSSGTARGFRPCTTPARVQSSINKVYRAKWSRPPVSYLKQDAK